MYTQIDVQKKKRRESIPSFCRSSGREEIVIQIPLKMKINVYAGNTQFGKLLVFKVVAKRLSINMKKCPWRLK